MDDFISFSALGRKNENCLWARKAYATSKLGSIFIFIRGTGNKHSKFMDSYGLHGELEYKSIKGPFRVNVFNPVVEWLICDLNPWIGAYL